MKKKFKIILTAFIAITGFLVAPAQQTKILTAEKHNEYGLVYTLPITALDIEVTAVKETRKAGPYFNYAKKYIGTDKVVREDAEVWTISAVKVRPYGIPNAESRYLMQLKPGATTYIGVAEDGMLLSINKAPELPDIEKTAIPPMEGEKIGDNEYLQYVDEDFIASQSSAKQAQMLAENLMEIREAKTSLTRGTAETMPTDGKQLELMLNSLAHQEATLTAAFIGNVTKETVVRNFTFTPERNGDKTLFRLSNFNGFVGADDYSGEPVIVSVEVTNEGKLPVDSKGEVKKLPKDAVAYCIPGTAEITISYQGKTLWSNELDMAQFGVVFGLNPSMFSDRKEPSFAVFDSTTGAIKEIGAARDTK